MNDKWVDRKTAAKIANVHVNTIINWTRWGWLNPIRFGRFDILNISEVKKVAQLRKKGA